jgi:SSS family solute:Na+ symporter
LLAGTLAAAIHHGITLPETTDWGIHGGWISHLMNSDVSRYYKSDMAQNFWAAIYAWTTCFVVTIVITLVTKPREDRELVGLVYSLTNIPKETHLPWYKRPETLGVVVLLLAIALNIIFW